MFRLESSRIVFVSVPSFFFNTLIKTPSPKWRGRLLLQLISIGFMRFADAKRVVLGQGQLPLRSEVMLGTLSHNKPAVERL